MSSEHRGKEEFHSFVQQRPDTVLVQQNNHESKQTNALFSWSLCPSGADTINKKYAYVKLG